MFKFLSQAAGSTLVISAAQFGKHKTPVLTDYHEESPDVHTKKGWRDLIPIESYGYCPLPLGG